MSVFKNIFGSSKKEQVKKADWLILDSLQQLDAIDEISETETVLLFKHSTRCSISTMAKTRLDGSLSELQQSLKTYYLDLIAHRDVSNEIANRYGVIHESPQAIVLKGGKSIFHVSHNGIKPSLLLDAIEA